MKTRFFDRIDYVLLTVVLLITLMGVIMIGSAGGWVLDPSNFSLGPSMKKQLIGIGVGMIAILILILISRPLLTLLSVPSYLGMLLLLLLVLLFGVGTGEEGEAEDVRRWLPFIGGITLQPSEFAKFLIIVAMSRFLSEKNETINKPATLALYLLLIGIPLLMIFKEPDLSTSIVFCVICAAMLFTAGVDWPYILGAVLLVVLMVFLILKDAYDPEGPRFLNDYQATRIWAYFDPQSYAQDYAYQTIRSQYAISSGGMRGVGLFNGSGLVPIPMTDFIFGIMGEELGFLGVSIYLVLLAILLYRMIWNASRAVDLYGRLLCVGSAAWIGIQSFIHIGVTTALLPNTGIPLPFVSYGVSSLISSMAAIGLVMHVYADTRAQKVRYEAGVHNQYLDLK